MEGEDDMTFRCGTIKEREEWVEELAYFTDREIHVEQLQQQVQKQQSMMQSGYSNSLTRNSTMQAEIENPRQPKDSTFSALFNCCSRPQTTNLE